MANDLLEFYQNTAAQVEQAAQTASKLALGGNLSALKGRKRAPLTAVTGARTILLELLQTQYQQNTTTKTLGTTVVQATGTAGAPQQQTLAAVILDVVPNAMGWPQRISVQMSARQSYQQTALGFHNLEWGIAIGKLDVNCLVYLGQSPSEAVKPFFDLLYRAKTTRPLAGEFPKTLRYTDSYLGKTFIISQDSVGLSESAEMQNMANLSISASILLDYDNAPQIAPTNVPTLSYSPEVQDSLNSLTALG